MDEHNLRIFLLCTHSVAGALPLGIVITSDEQFDTLVAAFNMIKNIFPEKSFYGKLEPAVFMTDNCSELREALTVVFPASRLLLCTFHILQQVWRWLFDRKHGVTSYDRVEIMQHFRRLVHTSDINSFEEKN